MSFRQHSAFEGQHAFLSPSNYHWINYDETKLENVYLNFLATRKGTELHSFAAQCIKLGQRLPNSKKTLNRYVNDAIGFRMTPEQMLFYSENCFGTADAISFKSNLLRIHDYKSGASKANIAQLEVYSALFCLEYDKNPDNINIELRIYQFDDVLVVNPDPSQIHIIMNKIIHFDKLISKIKSEEV